ncbi:MAG: serine/threonine-protein kinase, partial [Thermoanaerobaculia bacterium]|nr:serine/threonine-protein kinase [Thermoanaerobaculia bacterium]
MNERWNAIWNAFHAVLEEPAAERSVRLDELCSGDGELRREVEELLAAHEEGVPILDESVSDLAPTAPFAPEHSDEPSFRPGTVVGGRFEIVNRIAAGGMGEVYVAHDRELDRQIALKTLFSGRMRSESALARFRREIQLAQQVTHRNVCRVFDLFRDEGHVFLTMELLEGETLAERLRREGALSLEETKVIVGQIVAGLEAAHSVGVIHRDLKPSNVILVEDSTGLRAVVTDFGIATSQTSGSEDDSHLTRTGEMLGTPAYMAPEQLEGEETSPATDVYAVGLLVYEMVTGRRPFTGRSSFSVANRRLEGPPTSPRRHVPELDARWERVILHCLERDPADRFQHPREIVEALEDESVRVQAPSAIRKKRRTLLLAVSGLLLIVIAFAA